MKCPRCAHNGSRVVDSRPSDDGATIRRRRECENCGYRFTTYERVEATPLLVVKKMVTEKSLTAQKSYAESIEHLKSDHFQHNNKKKS